MSTHAYIFEKTERNYRGIYLHCDGYIESAGRILTEHYTDPDIVSKLIDLGSLSVLGFCIGKKTDFYKYDRNGTQCLAYHRDRGEELETLDPVILNENNISRLDASFVYLFDHDKQTWFLWDSSEHEWIDLLEKIEEKRDKDNYNDSKLTLLWSELTDVPTITEEYKNILDQNWFGWKKGTDVIEIWHWFDERLNEGLGVFMEENQ